jgi:hypothetical protein
MEMSTQFAKPVSSIAASGMPRESSADSAECFLTYANHLVEQILREYQIEVNHDAGCGVEWAKTHVTRG